MELKQARDEATVACNRLLGVLQRKRLAGNTDPEDLHELSEVLSTLAEEVQSQDSRVKRRRLQQSEVAVTSGQASSSYQESDQAAVTANLASCTIESSLTQG